MSTVNNSSRVRYCST